MRATLPAAADGVKSWWKLKERKERDGKGERGEKEGDGRIDALRSPCASACNSTAKLQRTHGPPIDGTRYGTVTDAHTHESVIRVSQEEEEENTSYDSISF